MKKIFVFLFLMNILISTNCQEVFISNDTSFERQSQEWNFTNIIFLDSLISKDNLFQKARQWFSESFTSSKAVIDNADKDEGIIFGHAIIQMDNSTYGYVKYNIEIRCKTGKIKYLINNFFHNDACIVNVYGYCPNLSSLYSIGSLKQCDFPERLGYNETGRGLKGRNNMWLNIKFKSKSTAYYLIESLKSYMNKDYIKEKDGW